MAAVRDPYRYFRIEARELLDQLGKGALELEKEEAGSPRTAQHAQVMLRLAHTLKGAARVVKQREISELAHAIEDLLAPYRNAETAVPRATINGVLAKLDAIAVDMARLPGPSQDAGTAASAVVPALDAPSRAPSRDTAEVDALLNDLAQVQDELAGLRGAREQIARARQLAQTLTGQLAQSRRTGSARSLEQHHALGKQLLTAVARSEKAIADSLDRTQRELDQAREQTEKLRLSAASGIFLALERTARDAAQATGKQLRFEAAGGDLRLDGRMLDAVQSALVQLVRNAVVHGIETEHERRASGKPSTGLVRIEVERRGRHVAFRCADDGRGLDLDAVRRALRNQPGGPSAAPGGTEFDPAELQRLLLQGGISTAGTVNEFAGRGIGLDLVRDTAHRLGGEVAVRSTPGTGTTVEMVMPLSLASFEVLIVQAGETIAAIPIGAVACTLRVEPGDVAQTAVGKAVAHGGALIPMVRLAPHLERSRRAATAVSAAFDRPCSAVVVTNAGRAAAVAVDRLLGVETIMQRALPPLAPASSLIAGVYLDGAGAARLVLDAAGLAGLEGGASRAVETQRSALPILVVDDSLTTRMLEQSILESAGYRVTLANSGEEGLDAARKERFGLILVDVEMPGMDGFTFVQRVRADPSLCEVPCILVTSRASPDDRRKGADAGAAAYIVKSEFDQTEFLDRVSRLVCI